MMTDGRNLVRIAAYGRISSHKDVMFKEKAALIQRYNAIILKHDGWLYRGMYIDSGSSHDQLVPLFQKRSRLHFHDQASEGQRGGGTV